MDDISYLISVIIVIIIVLIVFWYDHLTKKRVSLRENMRKLWLKEILWLKSYTTDIIENQDSGAKDATLKQLAESHKSMADLIYRHYSCTNSSRFITKFDGFAVLYGTLIEETLNNNMDVAKTTWMMMTTNGGDIAQLLHVNPYVCRRKLAKMMNIYQQNLSQIFTTRMERNWIQNNNAVEIALDHATNIADYLSWCISRDKYSLTSF